MVGVVVLVGVVGVKVEIVVDVGSAVVVLDFGFMGVAVGAVLVGVIFSAMAHC